MNPDASSETLGEQLAQEAVAHVLTHADNYCERERERISAANEPKIIAIETELENLKEEETALQDRIHRAPPVGDIKTRRRKARYYWAITALLAIAGFFFSLLAFDPYRLGWKSYLYCIGIAVVTPFCVEKFLETWSNPKFMKALAALACTAALASLVLLAVVRGDVLGQQIKTVSAVVFADGAPTPEKPQTDFYDKTLVLLRCVMGLLALAMEIGAGVALYEARRFGSEGEDAIQLSQELKQLRERIASRESERAQLQKEPSLFANRFWRDFHRGMLGATSRRALGKVAVVLLVLALFSPARAFAADRLNLVVGLDLTQSVAVQSPDQKTEFEKNLEGVRQVLAHAPAGARITVIGITDSSFAQPLILLSANLGDDAGYFQEKLAAGRTQLLKAWQGRSRALEARYPHTDILGACLVASEFFRQAPKGRNILAVFSDMREESRTLNLERPALVPVSSALARVQKLRMIADLKGVEVWVLGVDGAGKDLAHWQSLRDFWTAYFQKSGATLKAYSVLRDPPKLGE